MVKFKLKEVEKRVLENVTLFNLLAKADESLPIVRGKTGVVFDEKANEHYCLWEDHRENPERLLHILNRLRELELLKECELLSPTSASLEEITNIHSEALYNSLKNTELMSSDELKELSLKYDSVYFNPKTFSAALSSAGCSIKLTGAVQDGRIQNGMALIRPPGHQAMKDEFHDFCYFNNAALAAKQALLKGCKRVLIVDWDVHHGNGTQQAFYEDSRVLFISIHRYEKGKFLPNLQEGNFNFVGDGEGKGFNINIPLNETGLKNEDYLAIFHQIILPVSYEFCPDFVIVSCGYDAAVGSQEGKMLLTPTMYGHLTSFLMNFANGKLVVLLEGGYCLDSLAEAAAHTLRALLGKPCARLTDEIRGPKRSTVETILNVISVQKLYWKCFSFQPLLPSQDELEKGTVEGFKSIPLHKPKLDFEGAPTPEVARAMCEYPKDDRLFYANELKRLREETYIESSPNALCLSYDADMEKHCDSVETYNPERPVRTREIMKMLENSGALNKILILQSRSASEKELQLCHDEEYVKAMKSSVELSPSDRLKLADEYMVVFFNEFTWGAALLAAGNLLQVVDSVCTGDSQAGIAVIRPPGHHAERNAAMGFCFFNNVAIAAQYAINQHHRKKVLILDWDVHHGNGTQHCFENNPSVLYMSLHVFKNAKCFPFSQEADAHFVGVDQGKGFNVNVPWSKDGVGDGDYIAALNQILLPIAYEFNPDLVLISAGFDSGVNDPLGACNVSPECFGHMTNLLKGLANGNIILAFEGGYNVVSTSYCMTMCAKALLGDPMPPMDPGLAPTPSGVEDINNVVKNHKEFWQSLKFQVYLEPFIDVGHTEGN